MFDVSLNAKEYIKLYFELREISNKGFPLKPLDKEGQSLLEARTKRSDDWTKTVMGEKELKRTLSADRLPARSQNAVLN